MTGPASSVDCDVAIAAAPRRRVARARAGSARFKVALVEAVAPGGGDHPSFDERTTALANGSVRVFRSLGVWRDMERRRRRSAASTFPIRAFRSRADRRGGAGLEALGYVLPNRVMALRCGRASPRRPASGSSHRRGPRQRDDRRRRVLGLESDARRGTARATGRRSRWCAIADPRAAGSPRALGVRTDRDHLDHHHAALPRSRGLRALTADGRSPCCRSAMDAAESSGPGRPRTLRACSRCRTKRSSPSCRRLRVPARAPAARRRPARVRARAVTLERHVAERLAIVGNAAQGLHPIAGRVSTWACAMPRASPRCSRMRARKASRTRVMRGRSRLC